VTKLPNGTDAKEVALYFLNETTDGRATSAIIAKTISQTKSILKAGYTKEEIISVIDFCLKRGVTMYSIGYVSTCINDCLREIKKEEEKEKARLIKEEQAKQQAENRKAVTRDDESTKRNAEKARRIGIQSRLGKKFDFDMFEK
jgi:hypothetical protein